MKPRALVLFLALGVMWGSSYTLIKITVGHISALDLVTYRIIAGAVVTGVFALRSGRRNFLAAMTWRTLGLLTVSSLISFVAPYLLITWGEGAVAASMAGMLNTLTPIFTALVSPLFFRGHRLGGSTWIGIGIGLLGAAIVFHPWSGVGHTSVLATAAIMVAAASYGLGIIVQKRYLLNVGMTSIQLTAVQLVMASLVCLSLDPASVGQVSQISLGSLTIACGLGIFNTALTAVLMLKLVSLASATVSSSVTYLIAVISVFEGAVLLREPLGLTFVLGSVVIVVGVATVGFGSRLSRLVRGVTPSPVEAS
jgi:drug/metabolite transporter (DMT)-like permease